MTTEIVHQPSYMPALTVQQAIERRNAIVEFTKTIMRENTDYGVVPGTDKPTLLKPGAEKLCTQFGLAPTFEPVEVIRDWTGERSGGEPLFFYEYRCRLWRNGQAIGEGLGSCNSWEGKYRYRNAERLCPSCGAAAIKRSKFPPRGRPNDTPGWYCYAKAGGCGQEYAHNEPAIVEQEAGKVPNPNIFDVINTVSKMAQKRALIAATLIALNASEFFTQDMDDLIIDQPEQPAQQASYQEQPTEPTAPPQGKTTPRPEPAPADDTDKVRKAKNRFFELWGRTLNPQAPANWGDVRRYLKMAVNIPEPKTVKDWANANSMMQAKQAEIESENTELFDALDAAAQPKAA